MKHYFNKNKQKGFTLVELLVAMGIFVVVITASTTLFLKSLKAQRAIVAFAAVNDNLALSIEQMAREIRTGRLFEDNNGVGDKLRFESAQEGAFQNNPNQVYANVTYELNENNGRIERHGIGSAAPITPEEVSISSVKFIIKNGHNNPGPFADGPVLITMVIVARPTDAVLSGDYEVRIQTTISPRIIY